LNLDPDDLPVDENDPLLDGLEEDPSPASGQEGFHSGFVALLGRPNVGKSTLLNRLVGTKLAIVSSKPQTTRNRIVGVRTEPQYQFIFLDTPGIHKAREQMNRYMVSQALGAIADADVAVVIFECGKSSGGGDAFVLERVREAQVPFVAVLNKIDLLKPAALAKTWERFMELTEGAVDRIAVSALHDSGTEALLDLLRGQLPEGPMFYPEDTITDRSLKFQLSELIREQIFEATHEELPYAAAVRIESIEDKGEDQPRVVSAHIVVETSSQKGIMIGKKGDMLKRIGTGARKEMERLLGHRVYLELKVAVAKDWRSRPVDLQKFGYGEEEMD
jgi:GTPase